MLEQKKKTIRNIFWQMVFGFITVVFLIYLPKKSEDPAEFIAKLFFSYLPVILLYFLFMVTRLISVHRKIRQASALITDKKDIDSLESKYNWAVFLFIISILPPTWTGIGMLIGFVEKLLTF